MDDPGFAWFPWAASIAAVGLLVGLASGKVRAGPFVFSASVVAGYVVLIAVTGVWTAACPGCDGYRSYDIATRGVNLIWAFLLGGAITATIIFATWLGVAVAQLFSGTVKRG
jgi:hypothetical protein